MADEAYEDHISLVCKLTRDEVDKLYSPSVWNKRMSAQDVIDAHIKRVDAASEKAKSELNWTSGIPYGGGGRGGESESQKMDIFTNESTEQDAPIFVFIHGGYWQMLSRESSSFMAIPFVEAGAKVVVVGYDLSPKVSVDEIVDQIRKAVVEIVKREVDSNSRGVYLCGHSAGAHLIAMALDENLKTTLANVSQTATSIIKGAFLVNGIFDLRPLVESSENKALRLTGNSAWLNSPINSNHIRKLAALWSQVHLMVIVAENDSPEFRLQAKQYYDLLRRHGCSTKFIDLPDLDHFNCVERLDEPEYVLTKELLEFMQLRKTEARKWNNYSTLEPKQKNHLHIYQSLDKQQSH